MGAGGASSIGGECVRDICISDIGARAGSDMPIGGARVPKPEAEAETDPFLFDPPFFFFVYSAQVPSTRLRQGVQQTR